jgi:hypothetical protein
MVAVDDLVDERTLDLPVGDDCGHWHLIGDAGPCLSRDSLRLCIGALKEADGAPSRQSPCTPVVVAGQPQ